MRGHRYRCAAIYQRQQRYKKDGDPSMLLGVHPSHRLSGEIRVPQAAALVDSAP